MGEGRGEGEKEEAMRQLLFRISILTLLFVAMSAPAVAHAETFPEVMFILDASGSMLGQSEGQTKIEAARSVLEKIVPSLPPEVKVGLTAYGHRRKGDCNDVEILIPPGSDDRSGLLSHVQKINPKGMTPIANSIKMVVETLKTRKGETIIVLVSDGEETCNADPCGVVRTLKSSGIKFILHVVGFGVNEKQKEQLACLAEAGGGEYLGANNAGTLLMAFESVKKQVVQKVEKAKTRKKKAKTRLGKLNIKIPESSKISIAAFKVVRKKDGKVVKTIENPAADSTHTLLSDEYVLVAAFANPNYKPPTEVPFGEWQVAGGETATVNFGAVVFNIADSLSKIPADSVTLTNAETSDPSITLLYHGNGYYLFKPKPVPAGIYNFAIKYSRSPQSTVIARNIQVKESTETVVTIDSGITIKKPTEQSGDVKGWDLIPADGKEPILKVRRRWDNQYPLWRNFAVPPGTYDLYIHIKGMDEPLPVGEGITISQGELLEFDTGL